MKFKRLPNQHDVKDQFFTEKGFTKIVKHPLHIPDLKHYVNLQIKDLWLSDDGKTLYICHDYPLIKTSLVADVKPIMGTMGLTLDYNTPGLNQKAPYTPESIKLEFSKDYSYISKFDILKIS